MYVFGCAMFHFHRSCNSMFKCKKKCSCMINIDCGEQDDGGDVIGGGDDSVHSTGGQETQDDNNNEIDEKDTHTNEQAAPYKDYSIEVVGLI